MGIFKVYWKKYRFMFISGVFCVFLEAVCDLLQPTILSRVIDKGVAENNLDTVILYGSIMLGVALFGAVFAVIRNYMAGRVSQNLSADMRFDLFRKIQYYSVRSLDELDNASLITRLTNDVNQAAHFAGGLMRIFLKAPLLCFGGIFMSIMLNFRLSLILICSVIVVFFLIFFSMRLTYPLFSKVQRAIDKLNRTMREYLLGVRLIKAFGRYDYEEERFNGTNTELTSRSLAAERVLVVFTPLMTLAVNTGIVLILWFGSFKLRGGFVEIGVVIALVNYMTQILMSLMMMTNVLNMFIRMKASAERIEEVFFKPEETLSDDGERCPIESIRFENVTFSYPGSDEPALSDISFECEKGESIAIIGPTGSGKSTLVSLLLRFYPPTGGRILINGKDSDEIPLYSYRKSVSVAPQKSMLFSGTIRENLLWGDTNASSEKIGNASRVSAADDFIGGLPDGYEHYIKQGAVNISGGQKQRLSLARALVKPADVLIIDDSIGALDAITESRVRQGLTELKKERILFIVTQRISTAIGSDRIMVLDEGRLIAAGPHAGLLDSCPQYREIYRSQIGG